MAVKVWQKDSSHWISKFPPIYRTLFEHPEYYDFNQIIYLLEALAPTASPISQGRDPSQEVIEICATTSLANPSGAIGGLDLSTDGKAILWVHFLGLAGIQGPLPDFVNEALLDESKKKERNIVDFLNIFNHRLASLYHRFYQKLFPALQNKPLTETHFGEIFKTLCNDSEPNFFPFHGLSWPIHSSIAALEKVLWDQFTCPVHVTPWRGGWNCPPLSNLSYIGFSGQFQQLGRTMILGKQIFYQSKGISINLEVRDFKTLCEFLDIPRYCREKFQSFKKIIKRWCGINQECWLCLSIPASQVPPIRLNQRFALGKNSWLLSKVSEKNILIKTPWLPISIYQIK